VKGMEQLPQDDVSRQGSISERALSVLMRPCLIYETFSGTDAGAVLGSEEVVWNGAVIKGSALPLFFSQGGISNIFTRRGPRIALLSGL
jgi:hypothetical protein